MFWDNFYNACVQKGTKPNPLAKELNLASGSMTTWKNGKIPNGETLIKIADYLGVSVDYLLGRTENPNLSSINDSNNGIINNSSVNNSNQTIGLNPLTTDETAVQLLEAFQKLDIFGKAEVMNLIVKLSQKAG